MAKMEHTFIEPGRNVNLKETKVEFSKGVSRLQLKLGVIFFQKGIVLLLIGFLLGRALILSHLTPFSLPFFASVYMMRRKKSPIVLFGLAAGSLSISMGNAFYTLISGIVFLLIYKTIGRLHKMK